MIDNRLIGRASSFSEIQNIPPFEKRGARNRFEFSYNEYKLNPLVVSFFFFFFYLTRYSTRRELCESVGQENIFSDGEKLASFVSTS